MKAALFTLGVALLAWPAAAEQCRPDQSAVISAETRCVKDGGIEIGFYEDGGMKAACMQNRRVQNTCGPDGRLTRMHAFSLWLEKLKTFEHRCAERGGVFTYKDPSFREPTNENFCLQSQPEVDTNVFEEPLCNFRSVCPAVTVICEFPCKTQTDRAFYSTLPEPSLADLRR